MVIGGTSVDIIEGEKRIGGSAYYSSMALISLGAYPTLITNTHMLDVLFRGVADIIAPSEGREIIYLLSYKGSFRTLRAIRSSLISLDKLIKGRELRGDALIISPILNEISVNDLGTLAKLSRNFKLTALDLQGFVRVVREEGCIVNDVSRSYNVLSSLKEFEGPVVVRGEIGEYPEECRGSSLVRCAQYLPKALYLQTAGPRDVLVYDGASDRLCKFTPLPNILGDETGAGDIFLAVVAYYLSTGDGIVDAIAKGISASGLKTARPNTSWFTEYELNIISEKVKGSRQCIGR